MTDLEKVFEADVLEMTARLQKETGYLPSYFLQMVGESGGVGAAHRLLAAPTTSDGFTRLWKLRRLRDSIEAFTLLPWYLPLFSEKERVVARERLQELRFDVREFVREREAAPPTWWHAEQA